MGASGAYFFVNNSNALRIFDCCWIYEVRFTSCLVGLAFRDTFLIIDDIVFNSFIKKFGFLKDKAKMLSE